MKNTPIFLSAAILSASLLLANSALAAGDLTRRPVTLPDLVLGNEESDFAMTHKEYEVETGQAYRLKIISSGQKEYAFQAPDFFKVTHLRKVEAGDVEIKTAYLHELEFEKPGQAEIFFTPLVPGRYEFYLKGLESRGMTGHFVVK
ncbi:copper-binding protein [Halopseudomonas phragmitis]|uniref:Copper-binding protein n=2 Tax=Pseudomonadaceae TaxID=135621 RepID=A0A1V0B8R3_9GAMM|nr:MULTISPECIES: copper-binding protein [Pseudomonadaceae]AQZ96297.1 copper-binding protein [Halopseudomonas phragmitis]RHW20430.1 copper-binding protein [Pseudomonas jilinensis]